MKNLKYFDGEMAKNITKTAYRLRIKNKKMEEERHNDKGVALPTYDVL